MVDYKNEFETLKRVHDSTNQQIDVLEKENIALRQFNDILNREKVQWEKQKLTQERIINRQLAETDIVVQSLQIDIIKLKEQLKKD